MTQTFDVPVAPRVLWQPINPWTASHSSFQFGLYNISLGATADAGAEQAILDDVGSYGRQLGRIGDALEVLLNHIDLTCLTVAEGEAVTVLKAQLIAVRKIREQHRRRR